MCKVACRKAACGCDLPTVWWYVIDRDCLNRIYENREYTGDNRPCEDTISNHPLAQYIEGSSGERSNFDCSPECCARQLEPYRAQMQAAGSTDTIEWGVRQGRAAAYRRTMDNRGVAVQRYLEQRLRHESCQAKRIDAETKFYQIRTCQEIGIAPPPMTGSIVFRT